MNDFSLWQGIHNTVIAARKMKGLHKAPFMYTRAAQKLLYKITTGKDMFRDVIIQTNVSCTAKCKGCSVQGIANSQRDALELDEVFKIVDVVRKLGGHAVILTGGEPTLYPCMADVVRYARSKAMMTHSSTNGIAVTKKLLDNLHSAGLTTLAFNFWGIGKNHDEEVGVPGAYEKLLNNFEYSIKIGLTYFMNHVTTRQALENGDTFKLIDLALEKGCRGITLVDPCAYDAEAQDFLLTDEEFAYIDRKLKEKGVYHLVNKCARRLWGPPSCAAGTGRIFVTAYGDVCPCDYIPISFGNIREQHLEEIVREMQRYASIFACSACIAARDRGFVEKYIMPVFQSGEDPLYYRKHPAFNGGTTALTQREQA